MNNVRSQLEMTHSASLSLGIGRELMRRALKRPADVGDREQHFVEAVTEPLERGRIVAGLQHVLTPEAACDGEGQHGLHATHREALSREVDRDEGVARRLVGARHDHSDRLDLVARQQFDLGDRLDVVRREPLRAQGAATLGALPARRGPLAE